MSLLATIALVSAAAAAQETDVRVALTSGLAKVGETVAIEIKVTTTGGGLDPVVRFGELPEVEGVEFGPPTRVGTHTSIGMGRGGRTTSSTVTTYMIRLNVAGKGDYSIPPLTLQVGDQRITRPIEPLTLKVVEDIEASKLLYFQRQALPPVVYEGEPFELDLEFGWDAGIRFESVLLRLPWWGQVDGLIEYGGPPPGANTDFPLYGRRKVAVERLGQVRRDDSVFEGFRLRRRFVATRAGTLEFPRSIFELDRVVGEPTRFSRGRTRAYYQPLDPFTVRVRPVPEEGRPFDWTGAVGSIEASRDATNRDVDAGDVISFEVRYTGDANLEFFDAPKLERIDGFEDFRVLGLKDEPSPYERVITYDLVPLKASVTEIPAVPLSVFDTELRRFVTATTEPLPIRVRATESGEDPFGELDDEEREAAPLVMRDIEPRPLEGSSDGAGPAPSAVFAALFAAVCGWVVTRRRVRLAGDPASAEARRRRGALRSFERQLGGATGAKERTRALHEFLAARTGEPAEAWIGRASLAGAGDGNDWDELERELSAVQLELDRADFAGAADPAGSLDERLRRLARELVTRGFGS